MHAMPFLRDLPGTVVHAVVMAMAGGLAARACARPAPLPRTWVNAMRAAQAGAPIACGLPMHKPLRGAWITSAEPRDAPEHPPAHRASPQHPARRLGT